MAVGHLHRSFPQHRIHPQESPIPFIFFGFSSRTGNHVPWPQAKPADLAIGQIGIKIRRRKSRPDDSVSVGSNIQGPGNNFGRHAGIRQDSAIDGAAKAIVIHVGMNIGRLTRHYSGGGSISGRYYMNWSNLSYRFRHCWCHHNSSHGSYRFRHSRYNRHRFHFKCFRHCFANFFRRWFYFSHNTPPEWLINEK